MNDMNAILTTFRAYIILALTNSENAGAKTNAYIKYQNAQKAAVLSLESERMIKRCIQNIYMYLVNELDSAMNQHSRKALIMYITEAMFPEHPTFNSGFCLFSDLECLMNYASMFDGLEYRHISKVVGMLRETVKDMD